MAYAKLDGKTDDPRLSARLGLRRRLDALPCGKWSVGEFEADVELLEATRRVDAIESGLRSAQSGPRRQNEQLALVDVDLFSLNYRRVALYQPWREVIRVIGAPPAGSATFDLKGYPTIFSYSVGDIDLSIHFNCGIVSSIHGSQSD